MARRRSYTSEQITAKLRKAKIYLVQGKTAEEVCKQWEFSEQAY